MLHSMEPSIKDTSVYRTLSNSDLYSGNMFLPSKMDNLSIMICPNVSVI